MRVVAQTQSSADAAIAFIRAMPIYAYLLLVNTTIIDLQRLLTTATITTTASTGEGTFLTIQTPEVRPPMFITEVMLH